MSSVCTFYHFVKLEALEDLQAQIQRQCLALGLKGTVLLAPEGINGTLTGARSALEQYQAWLQQDARFAPMPFKYSAANPDNPVFLRLKVRIKPEIVALGRPDLDPAQRTGEHVDADTWNALLDDPDVIVIDTRNSYEVGVGTFPGAIDPGTRSFREFPQYVSSQLDPERTPRVAMFCTGGIRCEKASAYLLEQGFTAVYQLDGGVLRYLETASDNRWQGECFVFDQRVTVTPSLDEGRYVQCHACRTPLSVADQASGQYAEGLSCPHCFDQLTPEQRAAFEERRRQEALAQARGERHVGAEMDRQRARKRSAQAARVAAAQQVAATRDAQA